MLPKPQRLESAGHVQMLRQQCSRYSPKELSVASWSCFLNLLLVKIGSPIRNCQFEIRINIKKEMAAAPPPLIDLGDVSADAAPPAAAAAPAPPKSTGPPILMRPISDPGEYSGLHAELGGPSNILLSTLYVIHHIM